MTTPLSVGRCEHHVQLGMRGPALDREQQVVARPRHRFRHGAKDQRFRLAAERVRVIQKGSGRVLVQVEDRPVPSWRDADGHRIRRTLGAIVRLQLLPQSARFDAHDRIVTRIEADPAVEDLDTERELLQRIVMADQGVANDVIQEAAQTRAALERVARQQLLERHFDDVG